MRLLIALLCLVNYIVGVCNGNGPSTDKEPTVPEIILGPVNATVFVDRNHTMSCRAVGYPRPIILWQKKNETIGQWRVINRSNGRIRVSSERLFINRLLSLDTGFYRCVAENSGKNTSSGIAYLNVQAKADIINGPRNKTVTWGTEVNLFCEAVGKPLPARSWYKNGVVIKNQTTDLPLSGPRVTFNATETAVYECRVQNSHMEGVSNVSATAFVRVVVPDGRCESYEEEVCSEALSGSRVVFSRLSDPNHRAKMEKTVGGLLEDMEKNNVSGDCKSKALKVLCKMAFPSCKKGPNNKVAVRQPLCRESCLAVRNLFCEEWWGTLKIRDSFECQSLPQNKTTEKCELINFFDTSDDTETTDCYREVGEHYKGQVGVTESGFQCQPWSSQAPHRHKLNPAIIPGLRMNHCRNPGGLKEKPWCYTSNATVDWEYCNVPICENSSLSQENKNPEDPSFDVVAVLAALSTVPLILLGVGCFVVWRKWRRFKGHNLATFRSPDDENLMTELQHLPSVEVVTPSTAHSTLFSKYEFDRNLVVHVEDIAVGAFGPVFKARLNDRRGADQNGTVENIHPDSSKQYVAVKMLKDGSHESIQHEFVRQASLIASFDHPNIIRLIGVCFVGSPLCIALEFMGRGDLHSFLPTLKPSHFIYSSQYYVRQLLISKQLVSVLAHLEHLRFLHRDLAARNFLVSSENFADNAPLVKLADFGLAVNLAPGENVHVGVESEAIAVRWTAPESIAQGHFSFASDVWSFGILLWEVFSYGEKPYKHMQSLEDVSRFILSGGQLESPCPDHPEVFDMLRKCWHIQPKLRCSSRLLTLSIAEIFKKL